MLSRDLDDAIKKACTRDSEALELARAAEVVRKEIFRYKLHSMEDLRNCAKRDLCQHP